MTAVTTAVERVRACVASVEGEYGFEDDKRVSVSHFGQPYNDFTPITWSDLRKAVAELDRLAAALGEAERVAKAAEGRAEDYRTVAINQGWNWALCDLYGREEYQKQRGDLVDACALNAAETRARTALQQTEARDGRE